MSTKAERRGKKKQLCVRLDEQLRLKAKVCAEIDEVTLEKFVQEAIKAKTGEVSYGN